MAFSDSLASDLTTIALCWRVARSDGVVLGFTTHDRALDIAGLRYDAAPGMTPSAISLGDGLEVDTMEFAGALSAAAITGDDLAAGRYDGAALTVFMADWSDPAAGMLRLAGGTIGAIEQRTGRAAAASPQPSAGRPLASKRSRSRPARPTAAPNSATAAAASTSRR